MAKKNNKINFFNFKRKKLFETIVRQDMSFFDKSLSGELNSVINR